ncbi:MAG TPA: exodeoxyribonuclease VII small subunit [Acidimicrobiales bacterium]|nr:exodeoxyribonuclease VII small subunit [Acidimicrobiales bacterium]
MSASETTPEGGPPISEIGYAEAASELDGIIRELDQGLIDVDRLEVRFRRAIDLVEELDRRIHGVRERVDALIPRLDAIATDQEV